MLADPILLQSPQPESTKLDRQAFLNAARRGASLPPPSMSKEDTAWAEYAEFVLEQEAEYCQQ